MQSISLINDASLQVYRVVPAQRDGLGLVRHGGGREEEIHAVTCYQHLM